MGLLDTSLDERETGLKIVLGDDATYQVKGLCSIKFDLYSGKSIILHDVMYVPKLKTNMVSISTLKDKRMRLDFIKGKVLTWPGESHMKDAFTLDIELKESIDLMGDLY